MEGLVGLARLEKELLHRHVEWLSAKVGHQREAIANRGGILALLLDSLVSLVLRPFLGEWLVCLLRVE